MATNLSLDPKLIERALELSGEKTKKAAVTRALEEFVARRRQKSLLELVGKLEWDSSFDYKKGRTRSDVLRASRAHRAGGQETFSLWAPDRRR